MGGDVPEKYYVVQNNDMVRVKYILLYIGKDSPTRSLTCGILLCNIQDLYSLAVGRIRIVL